MTTPCPCGSNSTYSRCCEPLINRKLKPSTAEALMRSRYSAYCVADVDYLLHTRHPSQRNQDNRAALQTSMHTAQWRRLQVIHSAERGDQAEVEFVAFFTSTDEGAGQIHERSRFRLEGEQWYYLDGTHLPPIKLQRNDACWCGSGKKFKKCCG